MNRLIRLAVCVSLALTGCTLTGCSSARFQADVAAAKSNLYTAATVVNGLAQHAQVLVTTNPQAASVVGGLIANAAAELAKREGVSSEDAAALKSDLSSPEALSSNLGKVATAAAKLQDLTAPTTATSP